MTGTRRASRLGLALMLGCLLVWGSLVLFGRDRARAAVVDHAGAPVVRYVSRTGTDAGGCTSPSLPCATPQYAVDQAGTGNEIRVAGGSYADIHVRDGMTQVLQIRKTVMLRAGWDGSFSRWQPDQYPATLDAGGRGRGLVITGTANALVAGLRVTGGNVSGYGGGIYIGGGSATISNCVIFANQAAYGGGVYLDRSSARLTGNSILSNTVIWSGGGLFLFASPADLDANRVAGNTAMADGGGLYLRQSPASMVSSVVSNNQALTGDGGGLYLDNSGAGITSTQIVMNRSHSGSGLYLNGSAAVIGANVIASNIADYDGGGLYLAYSEATVDDNVIRGNQAAGSNRYGGGLYAAGGRSALSRNQVQDNTATFGGGLYLERGFYDLRQNQVVSNTASAAGGGIAVVGGAEGGQAQLDANLVAHNTATTSGGGVYLYSLIAVTLTNNSVLSNTAASYGGGLFSARSGLLLDSNSFQGNGAAVGYGGGFYLDGAAGPAAVRLQSNNFTGNQAGTAGGGLFLNQGDTRLDATTVVGNQARGNGAAGGGIYLLDGRAAFSNTIVAGNAVGPGNTAVLPAGSGIVADGAYFSFAHTTFARNSGGEGSALRVERRWSTDPAAAVLTNTVIAGQTVGVYVGEGAHVRLTGTLLGTGTWGVDNLQGGPGTLAHVADLAGDPAFVAPARGDYHISKASAAIDRGVAAGVRRDIDRQWRPNPLTNAPDLGADEWYAPQRYVYLPIIRRH